MSPESDSDRSKEVGPAVGRSAGEVGGSASVAAADQKRRCMLCTVRVQSDSG